MARVFVLAILVVCFPNIVRAQGGQSSVVRNGANLPTCNAATRWQIFVKTSGNVGVYVCSSDNLWHGFGIGAGNQIAIYDSTGSVLIGNTRLTDNGTILNYTGTGGLSAPSLGATNSSTAGMVGLGQGPNNTPAACNGVNCTGFQAPTSLPGNSLFTLPLLGAGPGIMSFGQPSSSVVPGSMSGDSNHSVSLTSQTASIAATNLCPATAGGCNTSGQYVIHWSIRNTVACATPGGAGVTLTVGWSDDIGAKSFTVSQNGTGSAGITVNLGVAGNFGQGTLVINSTGAAAITYSTTLAACTSGTATYNLQASVYQTD